MYRSARLIRIHSKYIHWIKYGRFTTLLVVNYVLQKYCIWFWRRTIPNMWGVTNSVTNLQSVILSLYQNKWISTSCSASNKQIALAIQRDIYSIFYSHGTKMVIFSWLLLDKTAIRNGSLFWPWKNQVRFMGAHICVR
jgi:hypothetical protein